MSTPDIQLEALHTLLSFLVVVFVVNGFTPQTKLYQFVQTRADNWLSGNCVWLTTAWVQSLFLAAIDKKYHQIGEKRFDQWGILSLTIKNESCKWIYTQNRTENVWQLENCTININWIWNWSYWPYKFKPQSYILKQWFWTFISLSNKARSIFKYLIHIFFQKLVAI